MVNPGEATLRALLSSIDAATRDGRPVPVGAHPPLDWNGLRVEARTVGTAIGRPVLTLGASLGTLERVAACVPIEKLLEHAAQNATVRVVVREGALVLESTLVWGEHSSDALEAALRWRLTELAAAVTGWRARIESDGGEAAQTHSSSGDTGRYAATPLGAHGEAADSLAELKRSVQVPADRALLVAAVAFGVAGADGVITDAERAKLRTWLAEVPAFGGLDAHRVVGAIASLVVDPARTLLESARRLEPRARLLAWALANDMAFADGFASDDERRYLTDVATVFKLGADDLAPLVAEAQERAIARETQVPSPPVH